jgi:hypothetical protein
MLAAGIPVGAGTDATRVASYNPWVSLAWLVSGMTVSDTRLYPPGNRVDRETALRLWTEGNTWFSGVQGEKGTIKTGQLADLSVLSADYMSVPESDIADIVSVLTLLGGKVVHGDQEYKGEAPTLPAPMPDWSPVRAFGGYQQRRADARAQLKFAANCQCSSACNVHGHSRAFSWVSEAPTSDLRSFWGVMGCSCWLATDLQKYRLCSKSKQQSPNCWLSRGFHCWPGLRRCAALANNVFRSCDTDAAQLCQGVVAGPQGNIVGCLTMAKHMVSSRCNAALDAAFLHQ